MRARLTNTSRSVGNALPGRECHQVRTSTSTFGSALNQTQMGTAAIVIATGVLDCASLPRAMHDLQVERLIRRVLDERDGGAVPFVSLRNTMIY